MKIKTLVLQNFMGVPERTIEFGDINNVVGRNGSGKTTILEAILFALFGKINGTDRVDGAIHKDTTAMYVKLSFEHKGTTYIVERQKDKKNSSISLNGKISTNEDIELILGCNYELFSSSFFAGYFMKFDDVGRYEILNGIFGSNLEETYNELAGKELAEKYPYGVKSIDMLKAELKTTEASIERIQHAKMLNSNSINNYNEWLTTEITCEVTVDEINLLKNRLTQHEDTKPQLKSVDVLDITKDAEKYENEISIIRVQLDKHLSEKPTSSRFEELKFLYKQSTEDLEKAKEINMCVTCNRGFSEDEKAHSISQIQSKIDMYVAEGKQEKTNLDTLLLGWEEKKNIFDKDLQSKQNALSTLRNNILGSQAGNTEFYNKQVKTWEDEKKNIEDELKEKESKYRDYLTKNEQKNSIDDKIKAIKDENEKLDKELEGLKTLDIKKVIEILGPTGVELKALEKTMAEIKNFLPENTEIILLEKNKSNDNYKKVFNVLVDGISYSWLSKGMKKMIDIHICNMLSTKSELNVIGIDDLESLTTNVGLVGTPQVINLYARDEDFDVKITANKDLTT